MNAMRDKPEAAARLRKLVAQLFVIAKRAKLVPYGFDPIRNVKPPKSDSTGYHRWTETELEMFETAHALGTRLRLRPAALRSATRGDVPIVEPLTEALAAGPLGIGTLLETKDVEPFTPKGFYGMMKRACILAGLPHCSPHGLRKSAARRCREAGCTDDEGMAITGHKTVKEYRRYAGEDARGDRADAAMSKVLANHHEGLAKRQTQPITTKP